MLANVNLAPSDDEDLYAGFGQDDVAPALQTTNLGFNPEFQTALKSSQGRRPPGTASDGGARFGLGTANGLRGVTGFLSPSGGDSNGVNRPMTGIRGAGYPGTASGVRPGTFDPLNQNKSGSASGLAPRLNQGLDTESPEEKIKHIEKQVNVLIEESCLSAAKGKLKAALDRAKEASTKERSLIRLREQAGLAEAHNLDLTFSVLFNLATQYAANDMNSEALNTYTVITKNRMFNNAGRLRVNMGNICFKTGQYAKAIKFYRMALDQVANTHKSMRIKIMHNIGILFVRMGQYSDACTSFEWIMSEQAEFRTGLHLILCYYALRDKERIKRGFQQLLDVPAEDGEDKYTTMYDDAISNLILEVIKNDPLRKLERNKKRESEHAILIAAKLIAPVVEETFGGGYDWCVDAIKLSQHAQLANDLEINKAIMFLRQKNFLNAVETLKTFENQDAKVASTAATNLSFLYYLQSDYEMSEKYGNLAKEADSYNPAAFVNLANCLFAKGDIESARELYQVALTNDSSCIEGLFNMGLCNKKLSLLDDALDCFFKLQSIVPNYSQVMFQIAHIYELKGDTGQAIEWYFQVIGLMPTDPDVLQRMANVFDSEGDKQQAYQYNNDSHRYNPSNMEVIDWLGSYFIEMQVSEKAIKFFEKAALMRPDDVRWELMIASCYRRSGNYHRALETYKSIHRRFPDNVDCLKFLVKLSSDMGLKEVQEYVQDLKKAERAKDIKEQRIQSSRPGSRRSSSRLSMGSNRTGSATSSDLGSYSPGNSRQASHYGRSMPSSATTMKGKLDLFEEDEAYQPTSRAIDSAYNDPLGPMPDRPKTALTGKGRMNENEFADEDVTDELLPE